MTENQHSIWFLSGYGITLTIFLYFGLNGLVVSTTGNTFPNTKFMTFLVLLIIVTWSMGLGVRRYINRFTKEGRTQIKKSFLMMTLISWLIVLILSTVT